MRSGMQGQEVTAVVTVTGSLLPQVHVKQQNTIETPLWKTKKLQVKDKDVALK